MPNRILREGILTSEGVNSLSWQEEVFYRRLMSVVDDFGRYYASPKLLRAACYPLHIDKVSDSDIGKWLTACVTAALVRVYPASDGKRYLELEKFGQQVRAKASKFPSPADDSLSTCVADAKQMPANAHLDVSVSVSVSEDEKRPAQAPSTPRFELPDWVNRLHWDAWHSGGNREKATDAQKAVSLAKLAKWREQGENHAGALENAAAGGYQGLFLPDKGKFTPSQPSATVPSRPGRDPELERIDRDREKAVPIPANIRAAMAGIKLGVH